MAEAINASKLPSQALSIFAEPIKMRVFWHYRDQLWPRAFIALVVGSRELNQSPDQAAAAYDT